MLKHFDHVTVAVTDGVVHYFGTIDSEDQRQAARVAAENVPGVRRVEDHRLPIAGLQFLAPKDFRLKQSFRTR